VSKQVTPLIHVFVGEELPGVGGAGTGGPGLGFGPPAGAWVLAFFADLGLAAFEEDAAAADETRARKSDRLIFIVNVGDGQLVLVGVIC
jgi:hypothetical protein